MRYRRRLAALLLLLLTYPSILGGQASPPAGAETALAPPNSSSKLAPQDVQDSLAWQVTMPSIGAYMNPKIDAISSCRLDIFEADGEVGSSSLAQQPTAFKNDISLAQACSKSALRELLDEAMYSPKISDSSHFLPFSCPESSQSVPDSFPFLGRPLVGAARIFPSDLDIHNFVEAMMIWSTYLNSGTKPGESSFNQAVAEWAAGCKLNLQEVKLELERWTSNVNDAKGAHEMGLSAFAKGEYSKAHSKFGQLASAYVGLAGERLEGKNKLSHQEVSYVCHKAALATFYEGLAALYSSNPEQAEKNFEAVAEGDDLFDVDRQVRLAAEVGLGIARLTTGRPMEAINALEAALKTAEAELTGSLATDIQLILAEAIAAHSRQLDDTPARDSLSHAVKLFRQAFDETALSSAQSPSLFNFQEPDQNLRLLQAERLIRFGTVLQELGERTPGQEGNALIEEASERFSDSLAAYKLESLEWALVKKLVGSTLFNLGRRLQGESGSVRLAAAQLASETALDSISESLYPDEFRRIKYLLGNIHLERALQSSDSEATKNLELAKAAFVQVLGTGTSYNLNSDELQATTLNNLGTTSLGLAILTPEGKERERHFEAAADHYARALKIWPTRGCEWGIAQANIALSLTLAVELGIAGSPRDQLKRARKALCEAHQNDYQTGYQCKTVESVLDLACKLPIPDPPLRVEDTVQEVTGTPHSVAPGLQCVDCANFTICAAQVDSNSCHPSAAATGTGSYVTVVDTSDGSWSFSLRIVDSDKNWAEIVTPSGALIKYSSTKLTYDIGLVLSSDPANPKSSVNLAEFKIKQLNGGEVIQDLVESQLSVDLPTTVNFGQNLENLLEILKASGRVSGSKDSGACCLPIGSGEICGCSVKTATRTCSMQGCD